MLTKILRLITILCLLCIPAQAGMIIQRFSSAASSCTDIPQVTSNDYWLAANNVCQRIQLQPGCSINTVSIELYADGGDTTAHVEIWPTNDKTGTQIGADSATVTITAVTAGTVYTFTWGTSPVPTTDFFIHIENSGGNTLYVRSNTDETSYLNTDYDLWRDGSEIDGDNDMAFALDYN